MKYWVLFYEGLPNDGKLYTADEMALVLYDEIDMSKKDLSVLRSFLKGIEGDYDDMLEYLYNHDFELYELER